MTGREYLNEYLSLGRSLAHLQNDILSAREQASKVTPSYSTTKIQSSNDPDKIGAAITTAVLLEERLNELIWEQAKRTRVILDVMRPMGYGEQALLISLFLNNRKVYDYAEEIERSEKYICRMKKKVLDHFDELFVDPSVGEKDDEAL